MTPVMLKKLLDACFTAKRITELMPELPAGMTPRHIHVIDTVFQLGRSGEAVHPRDVCERLNLTPPSVTRLIGDLEKMRCLNKENAGDDKRYVSLALTDLGRRYYDEYVDRFHRDLSVMLGGVDDRKCRAAIAVVDALHDSLDAYIAKRK